VAGHCILLVAGHGQYHALDARCGHRGGPLEEGLVRCSFLNLFSQMLKVSFCLARQATWKTWKTWKVFWFGALGMADATGSTPVVRRSGRSFVIL